MNEHPFRADLRAAVPTLEPDEAFLAELDRVARAAPPVRAGLVGRVGPVGQVAVQPPSTGRVTPVT